MGRLGNHPDVITVHDFGEQEGQSYLVIEVMEGGEVEELVEKAPEHRLSIEEAYYDNKEKQKGGTENHGNAIKRDSA